MPDALNDRFARDWRGVASDGPGIALVALSGGPDSVALLLLLHALLGERIAAATVDHGLRPEAAAEARFAAALCAARGIAHRTLAGPLPPHADGGSNLSARARALRYDLLGAHADAIGARWIATAHHADDQLETMVLRLNRGAGVAGLAGVRPVNGRIVRPLLHWRRVELAAIVAAAGVAAVADPSNSDDRYDRARLRKALAGIDWLDPAMATRSADALADAEAALGWAADRAAAQHCVFAPGEATLDPAGLPVELVRRLALRCLAQVDPAIRPRGEELGRVIAALAGGGRATLGRVLCDGGAVWRFGPAPPHRRNDPSRTR